MSSISKVWSIILSSFWLSLYVHTTLRACYDGVCIEVNIPAQISVPGLSWQNLHSYRSTGGGACGLSTLVCRLVVADFI